MLRTKEDKEPFWKGDLIHFKLKNEYLIIIQIILLLLNNSFIRNGLIHIDNHTKIKYQLDQNYLSNTTKDVTSTFLVWIIFKFILIYININGDCLTYIKHDTNII